MFEYLLRRHEAEAHDVHEAFELHQLSINFKQEQAYREERDAYCREYSAIAQRHQQEHADMQNEPNLFALFWRKREKP